MESFPSLVLKLEQIEQDAWTDLYEAAPEPVRETLGIRVEKINSASALLVRGIDYEDFNRVIGLGVDEPATERAVDRMLAFYRDNGIRRFLIHLAPVARPANIRQWLEARGLVAKRRWAKMYRPPEPLAGFETKWRLAEVAPEEAERYGRVVCAGFEMPESIAPWNAATVGRVGWKQFLALDGEEAIGCGSIFVSDGMCWLGVGATVPGRRRQGAQGAVMARRIAEGIALDCKWLATETAEDLPDKPNPSLHNMIRTGFLTAYLRENFGLPAGA
jgi:hypothetical protein